MSTDNPAATYRGGGWDSAVIADLRRVYMDGASVPLIAGGGFGLAHDAGLRAVAMHVIEIERDR